MIVKFNINGSMHPNGGVNLCLTYRPDNPDVCITLDNEIDLYVDFVELMKAVIAIHDMRNKSYT